MNAEQPDRHLQAIDLTEPPAQAFTPDAQVANDLADSILHQAVEARFDHAARLADAGHHIEYTVDPGERLIALGAGCCLVTLTKALTAHPMLANETDPASPACDQVVALYRDRSDTLRAEADLLAREVAHAWKLRGEATR